MPSNQENLGFQVAPATLSEPWVWQECETVSGCRTAAGLGTQTWAGMGVVSLAAEESRRSTSVGIGDLHSHSRSVILNWLCGPWQVTFPQKSGLVVPKIASSPVASLFLDWELDHLISLAPWLSPPYPIITAWRTPETSPGLSQAIPHSMQDIGAAPSCLRTSDPPSSGCLCSHMEVPEANRGHQLLPEMGPRSCLLPSLFHFQ